MNNKGFTTVEVLISVVISSIVMGAVGSFLVFNVKGFKETKDTIDVQYEGQMVMNQIVDLLTESCGIEDIDGTDTSTGNTVAYESYETAIPSSLVIKQKVDSAGVFVEKEYKIKYNSAEEKIMVETDGVTYELGRYISKFEVSPTRGSYKDTNTLSIKIEITKNGKQVLLENQVKMRNK